MSLRAGDAVEHFVIVSLLGQGGMGEVYLARDVQLQRSVALKIMRPERSDDLTSERATGGAARLLREAQAAAGLDHPNVVTVFEVGEIKGEGEGAGRPFIAMELVKGRTLRALIGDPSAPMRERIRWLTDVARALTAAHRAGLVHRDIKPENVMVRDDGVVKVLDFGLAKRGGPSISTGSSSTEAQVLPSLTGAGVAIGTPYYMAPEQMRRETLDGRTDQFAWGVVAYELLSGEPAWGRGVDALGMVSKILSEDPKSVEEVCPEVPAHVAAVVKRALAKKREARFETMDQLLRALAMESGALGPSIPAPAPLPSVAQSVSPRSETLQMPSQSPLAKPARTRRAMGTLAGGVVLVTAAAVASRLFVHLSKIEPSARDASPALTTESRMSSNAQATAAYKAGIQAMRDGSLATAKEELDRALDLDPHFAAAHLRRAILPAPQILAEQRQDLLDARESRGDLGDLERVLLDACQPSMDLPPDPAEARRRKEAAVKLYPANGELEFLLAVPWEGTADEAAAYDAAIAKDPGLAIAWGYKARYLDQVGDLDGAEKAYAKCLGVSPSATTCLEGLAALQAARGQCDQLVSTSRQLTAVGPRIPAGYDLLAQGLLNTNQTVDSVRAVLRRKWERLPRDQRKYELGDEAGLSTVSGDFDGALRWLRDYDEEVASSPIEGTHFYSAYGEILLNLEVGRTARAVEIAHDFLRQRSGWEVYEYGPDVRIFFYAVEAEAGDIPRSEADALRVAWDEREKERLKRIGSSADPTEILKRWAFAYANFATTPPEAKRALEHRPDLPASFRTPDPDHAHVDDMIGRAYKLAGRLDEAAVVLAGRSKACMDIDAMDIVFTMRAALDLGETLEERGDKPGACEAYRKVLDRWEKAKPPSRTAARAKERVRVLRCGG